MGCFVRGGKNGMGCFVRGDKICMGCFVRVGKLMRDVLSGVAKNGMGCFVLHSDALTFLLDNILIWFGTKLYRHEYVLCGIDIWILSWILFQFYQIIFIYFDWYQRNVRQILFFIDSCSWKFLIFRLLITHLRMLRMHRIAPFLSKFSGKSVNQHQ